MLNIILFLTAFWPVNGLAVYDGDSDQINANIVSDNAWGVFYCWDDKRSGDYDIYIQHIDSAGSLLWNPQGIPVCSAQNDQFIMDVVEDGVGGILVCWLDARSGSDFDLYAQRIDANGTMLWGQGIAVCDFAGAQYCTDIISDQHQGFIAVWQDYRGSSADIYAQRIDSAGNRCWTVTGLPICTVTNDQSRPKCIAHGVDNFVISWEDRRSGDYDIYGQRIDLSGTTYWTVNGKQMVAIASHQFRHILASSSDSHFVLVWEDSRNGPADINLYAQKYDWQGYPLWGAGGIVIDNGIESQRDVHLARDGLGGLFICWSDIRNADIFCQHLDSSGAVIWETLVTTGTWLYHQPRVVVNDSDGVIVQWNGVNNENMYAQSLDNLGNAMWQPSEGVPVCTFTRNMSYNIITDNQSGFYTAYSARDSISFDYNGYLQRIYYDGSPAILGNRSQRVAGISIYPNPAVDNITFNLPTEVSVVRIYDVLGREVFCRTLHKTSFQWNFSNKKMTILPTGVYFVQIEVNDLRSAYKIVKLK
ncbi:T9SS type A sorting domain-containing protein [candidate division WOR-3 bacterium]|nr:T9SS type A sorting domain-containing protein [candidate division WOR-3 bacterium]